MSDNLKSWAGDSAWKDSERQTNLSNLWKGSAE